MTVPVDALYTLLVSASLLTMGGLAFAVLPWSDAELDASQAAWAQLVALPGQVLALLFTPAHQGRSVGV